MKYPIGIQTFEKIIEDGYVYVDKTDLIYKLVNSGEYYFLSRPRRFGKSLLTSTLEAYFLGRKELFKGLAIEEKETKWEEYPVFHLDFSGETYIKSENIDHKLEVYFTQWEKQYGKNPIEKGFGNRLSGLIQRACERTGKKAVILVDEYDKPLTDAIGMEELQEQNRAVLQGLYGVFKNADKNIKFTFLTGVTRYGKLGIFSAANNLEDISMSRDYATICGITENELHGYFDEEVFSFAQLMGTSKEEMYNLLKKQYNGYHFSANVEGVYNPFSLLGALKKKMLESDWFATGTPTYLARLLKENNTELSSFNNDVISTTSGISSFGNGEDNMVAALYQSGYLTIKSFDGKKYYRLGFPNEEVAEGFVNYLLTEFTQKDSHLFDGDFEKLSSALDADDVDAFMNQIKFILSQVPFESTDVDLIESNFRNMVYLMIRATGIVVNVEHPVLGGRIDICFETGHCSYIIECKRNESAQTALSQIDERRYDKKISLHNKKLVKIGANFSTEERNLTEWLAETNKKENI